MSDEELALLLIPGLLGFVSVLIISGIPELFAILIAVAIFLLIAELDREFVQW